MASGFLHLKSCLRWGAGKRIAGTGGMRQVGTQMPWAERKGQLPIPGRPKNIKEMKISPIKPWSAQKKVWSMEFYQ